MKLTNSILASLAAGVLIFAGCGGGAYAPKNTTKYDLENKTSFVLMDAMVQRSVTCSGIQERRLADGRLEIVANIRNRETRRIEVQVSCVFKDAQGFPTGDETPWAPLILTENAQEGVRITSMNDKAYKYTVRVRQAH
jgi:hypothetical protein